MSLSDPLTDAELLIRSRHPFLLIEGEDRSRSQDLLRLLADRMELPLFRWSRARGLVRIDRDGSIYETRELEKALRHIAATEQAALYLLDGLESVLPGSALVQSKFTEALDRMEALRGALIHAGPSPELPASLRSRATTLRLPGPSREELRDLIAHIYRDLSKRKHVEISLSRAEMDQLVNHLLGLTMMESEKILTRAILEDGMLSAGDLDGIAAAKRRIVERDGLLEYYPVEESFAQIADLENLRDWLRRRTALVRDPEGAREFGLTFPKGILLAGVPGCGKSLSARAIATEWRLPLLKLDPSALYNRYVGETESNFRRAMELAERMAPVVLWIDELEKAFASGDREDGGVSRRVLGTFLNWMQERTADVFVLATANDVDRLPAELMRKGRFDELFFVDLPDQPSREEILRIHLRRRNQDPSGIDTALIAEKSRGFSGAELEQVVVSALYAAFADGESVDTRLLMREVGATRPLSVTARERIERLRAWARERTVSAN
ncbi:MAG: AAA family ATPase [Gemmatimonadales bacterium]|nr:MAG: AAA family ATPase [Gemmatimonadales bacterium]